MSVEKSNANSCSSSFEGSCCCKIESLVSVDERGQMVLPKEIRDKANIEPGDKFIVTTWEKGGKVCCISLIKVDEINSMVKDMLSNVVKDIV